MKRKKKPIRAPQPAGGLPPHQPPAGWPLWFADIGYENCFDRTVLVSATSWTLARVTAQRYAATLPARSSEPQVVVDRAPESSDPSEPFPIAPAPGQVLVWIEPDPCAPFGHLRVTRTP